MISRNVFNASLAGFLLSRAFCTTSWRGIADLPKTYKLRPMPTPPDNCDELPLEQIVPLFLTNYIIQFQCGLMQFCAPSLAMIKEDNQISVITSNGIDTHDPKKPAKQNFISFRTFLGKSEGNDLVTTKEKLQAFVGISMISKCNQVTVCFGQFILKYMQSHQMTYKNEKIVGWAVQDGYVSESNRLKFKIVDISHPRILKRVVRDLRDGIDEPDVTKVIKILANDDHIWLTFVTESGKIFDMDLSAFQFGITEPHPNIHPVVLGDPLAFGTVKRSSLCNSDITSFASTLTKLAEAHTDFVRTTGSSNVTAVELLGYFELFNSRLINLAPQAISVFKDPNYFWNSMATCHFD